MQVSLSILSQAAQMVGVFVIALLLWPVVRVIRERYLVYWAWGWALMATGLVALFLAFNTSAAGTAAELPLRVVYCQCSYGFGFLLWTGSRRYATGRRIHPADLLWLLPSVGYGLLGPLLLPTVSNLFGWHAAFMAAFFLAALWQTRRFKPHGQSPLGLRLYQWAVLALCVLFAHYAVVHVYHQFFLPPGSSFRYLSYSSVYDLALEAVLALGTVSIATERMRAELEEKNRRLLAAAELELAARTDPLTGLLNRRGLSELLKSPERVPAGCVATIDLNDLKVLNDRHGHASGDVAIQLVARGLRTLFRVTDPILRLGGDEFAVVMPGGSPEELTRRLTLLDAALKNQRVPGVEGPTDVQLAWGVATYTSADQVTAALAEADHFMYEQKRQRKGE